MLLLPNEPGAKKAHAQKTKTKIQAIYHLIDQDRIEKDEKVVLNTCHRLISYMKDEQSRTLDNVKNLISHMERSLLSLHRKKQKLVEKRRDKRV